METVYHKVISELTAEYELRFKHYQKMLNLSNKQIERILLSTFGVAAYSIKPSVKHAGMYLTALMHWLHDYQNNFNDAHAISTCIKRLTSPNGIETSNEIFAHVTLNFFLSSYKVAPLFGQGADGFIGEQNIPVEIKSRFPKVFELLNYFIEGVHNIIPRINGTSIYYDIGFISVKGITKQDCDQEIAILAAANSGVTYNDLPYSPDFSTLTREEGALKYTIRLFKEPSIKNMGEIYIKNHFVDPDTRLGSYLRVSITGETLDTTAVNAFLFDDARAYLANNLISECIKKIKNMPDEPRMIAIYAPHVQSCMSLVRNVVDAYASRHPGTMIIILAAPISGTNIRSDIYYMKAGADIEPIVKEYYKPLLLAQLHKLSENK
jgi:hypothetical protein